MTSGLLLALPLESVMVRLVLALGAALVLLRIVSGWDLRSPRARTVLATSPFVVAAAVVVLSSGDLGLPSLLVPSLVGTSIGGSALALPVADRYLDFVPGAPVVVGLWALVSLGLVGLRVVRAARTRRELLAATRPAGPRLAASVLRLSRRLGVEPPRVLVRDGGVSGAAVLGVRHPVLLLDARMIDRLDDEELDGVLAHELAHIARHDNVLAWAVSLVRDLAFFVPGAGWALRALHREREVAADHEAVAITRRPAALASGLLQVVALDRHGVRVPHGCAALVPSASVEDRVRALLSEDQPTARDHRVELGLAGAVSLVAVALAVVVPSLLVGAEGQRDALGLLVNAPAGATSQPATSPEVGPGRVFGVLGAHGALGRSAPTGDASTPVAARDLFGTIDRPGVAAACATGGPGCVRDTSRIGMVLRPAPIVLVDPDAAVRWQATPVGDIAAGERFAMYWLARTDLAP